MHCQHCDSEITTADHGVGKINECRDCAQDVERYVGHMIWDHKTAPVIEIHAGKDSLAALKDGRYNRGLKLVREVKERSRRREGDAGGSGVSLQPFRRKSMSLSSDKSNRKDGFAKVEVRNGSGKTFTSFPTAMIKAARANKVETRTMSEEKLRVLLGCAKLPSKVLQSSRVNVWRDDDGFYVRYNEKKSSASLDHETTRSLGYRGANYRRV